MKKKIVVILGIALLIIDLWKLTGNSLSKPASVPATTKADYISDFDYSEIDAYIKDEMKSQKIPGLALAIIKNGEIIQVKGYGQTGRSGKPVTPDTPFMIGSNSKSFTAMAVLQLVETGKIDLDAPIQQYIPEFKVLGKQSPTSDLSQDDSSLITVRHLLHQTSGLPQFPGNKIVPPTYDEEDALERNVEIYTMGKVRLNHQVGKSYEYANDNYNLLGLIVQRVSGQSYESYVKEYIFEPLSMHNSFTSEEKAFESGLATAHRRWFGFNMAYTSPYTFNRGEIPAGYIISSAEDLSHYVAAQLNEGVYENVSILSSGGINLMRKEPVPNTYAMGWISDNISGIPVFGHSGGSVGYQSHIWFSPKHKLGVVVLANTLGAVDTAFPNTKIVTTTHLASGVMSLIANSKLPDQSLNITRKYWMINGMIVLLSIWFLYSVMQVSTRYKRLGKNDNIKLSTSIWRLILVIVLHFIWPVAVFVMTVTNVAPIWHVLTSYQPDLILWMKIMAIVVFLKGVVEILLSFQLTTNR